MLIRLLQVAALLGLLLTQAVHAAPDSVNVNTADAELIAEVLDGVGMSRAQAIVDYRENNGDFADAYYLANVKGIGDRTVELNVEKIKLRD